MYNIYIYIYIYIYMYIYIYIYTDRSDMNSQLFRVLGAPAFPSKVGQPDAERQSCVLATAYSCWGGSWLENDLSWVPSCYVFCWLHLGMKHCFIMFFNCCAKLCLGSMDDGSVWSTLQNTQIKVAATAE